MAPTLPSNVSSSPSPQVLEIIDAIILAETGGDPNGGYTNDPHDRGGRTIWGIAESANPDLWRDGPPSREAAVQRYYQKYVVAPQFHLIVDGRLQAQVVDMGVTSGTRLAVEKLQGCVGAKVDGQIGPETLTRINSSDPVILNNKFARERVKMIGRLVQKRPGDLKYLNGWLNRILPFFIP